MIRALYLDDVRTPPTGGDWTLCRTIAEAQAFVLAGPVDFMSLDHDLDLCPICHRRDESFEGEFQVEVLGACVHPSTGYDFVKWLAETGNWPRHKPMVHSANPVGAHAMRQMIDRHWRQP